MSLRYRSAERLEQVLGDPIDSRSPMSFARVMALDEAEQFPSEFIAVLKDAGVFQHLVPFELGGALQSFDESLMLLRLIARRDLTTAIAFGQTFLGAIPVWLAGSDAQKQALAGCIRDGELGCLALTEEAHGGDLLACEFSAERRGSEYALTGRKWLINNGAGGGTVCVYSRTGDRGASAFSLFLLEKRRLRALDRFRPLPKIHTLGIRGADISGFECHDLPVAEAALVGPAGRGYEITLKTLQVSRTMCAALSLGAGDTALRTALAFARQRKVFNDTVANIPSARAHLTSAYADLLVCECVATAAARALQACPERMAVWSSIVKWLVPTVVEGLIGQVATVLGARYYVREAWRDGIFQKCLRDNAVVALFDGSTAVNLHIISGQLPALGNRRVAASAADADRTSRLRRIFDARDELPWRAFPRLSELGFTNNGFDEIVDHLATMEPDALPRGISGQVRRLAAALVSLDARVAALQETDPQPNSPERFELAARYALVHAGAACVLTWQHNRGTRDAFFDEGGWLAVCLERVLRRLGVEHDAAVAAHHEAMYQRMAQQLDGHQLFSLWPVSLGAPSVAASASVDGARP